VPAVASDTGRFYPYLLRFLMSCGSFVTRAEEDDYDYTLPTLCDCIDGQRLRMRRFQENRVKTVSADLKMHQNRRFGNAPRSLWSTVGHTSTLAAGVTSSRGPFFFLLRN
jgi:hypothetical protein